MERERTFNIEAVVLRHRDWGEADRIITIYSKEFGKSRVIVKGARKIKSRKAGHVEPFSLVRMQLSRTRDMPILTQVDTIRSNQELREDLDLIAAVSYLVELVDKFTQDEHEGDGALYQLIKDCFETMRDADKAWYTTRYFESHLLDIAGYRPEFFTCVECHKKIVEEDQYFVPSSGGVVCATCGRFHPGAWRMPATTLKYLRYFQKQPFKDYGKAKPSEQDRARIEEFFQNYFKYLLERALNTSGFIQSIKHVE